jgi:hypothetical protein
MLSGHISSQKNTVPYKEKESWFKFVKGALNYLKQMLS